MSLRIAMIGTGSMGGALLSGMLSSADPASPNASTGGAVDAAGVPLENARATTKSQASAEALAQRTGVSTMALDADPAANRDAAAGADFVFLGVKPWMIADTLTDLAPSLEPEQVIVSMAAGVSIETLAQLVPDNPIVRIMPNTPSEIGQGVIALAPASRVPAGRVEELSGLLSGAGRVFAMSEEQIGAMIGISGSGVAYFFLLAEEMVKAGVDLGLSEDAAREMVVATAQGAGSLLALKQDPAALRQAVTSKGGTTHAAIETFRAHDLEATVKAAAQAAYNRAQAMEEENA
ncbi:pyrroline-5-carboxylate reductase [Brevibacterium sp. 91QC2O2]|uniref:pyrroline-5-carboxylate reductase n=1 Tax=Brevibacterium TaxID=1696 RepID=UPI00211BB192|nr:MULTISPECIES: pyrroline-5-carboxylate reductase [unclassified Brevibacterium]MCQ9368224.1 pyrroline-5-carboxylate reductase [Brevibacterium sp. 91QC2O2]MCQ9385562.1 pyrroline-5-carboxylate reductase [Brevibacterium sp. 68QC2CO]